MRRSSASTPSGNFASADWALTTFLNCAINGSTAPRIADLTKYIGDVVSDVQLHVAFCRVRVGAWSTERLY